MSRNVNKPSPPSSIDTWQTSAAVPLLSDLEVEEEGEEEKRVSTAEWSTSAIFPTSSQHEGNNIPEQNETPMEEKRSPSFDEPESPTSPNSWSSPDNVPLLSDVDEKANEEEKAVEDPKEETKKGFSSAEYRVAFSHFVVRTYKIVSRSILTDKIADLFILNMERQTTSLCCLISLHLHRCHAPTYERCFRYLLLIIPASFSVSKFA